MCSIIVPTKHPNKSYCTLSLVYDILKSKLFHVGFECLRGLKVSTSQKNRALHSLGKLPLTVGPWTWFIVCVSNSHLHNKQNNSCLSSSGWQSRFSKQNEWSWMRYYLYWWKPVETFWLLGSPALITISCILWKVSMFIYIHFKQLLQEIIFLPYLT